LLPVIPSTREVEAEDHKFKTSWAKDSKTLSLKHNKSKRVGREAQVIEQRPWAQSLIPQKERNGSSCRFCRLTSSLYVREDEEKEAYWGCFIILIKDN
jgi:hypothetical protein